MAFLSLGDPSFWENLPPDLKHMQGTPELGTLAIFRLGEKKEDNPPTVAILKMPPGAVLPRHAHDCWRFEMILQGSMDVGDRMLRVGDVMTSAPRFAYGPHVAGPEGCVSLEIFSNFTGSHLPIMELPDGQVQFDTSTPEGNAEMVGLMKELMQVATAQLTGSQAAAVARYMADAKA